MDDVNQAIIEHILEFLSTQLGVPTDEAQVIDLMWGKKLSCPIAGTPDIGEWYSIDVYIENGSVSVEHWRWCEDMMKDDKWRVYGPFELTKPDAFDQIDGCLRRIVKCPTF